MAIELPKDAEGREIPLDTTVLFGGNGNVYHIVRWTFVTDFDLKDGWLNNWQAVTDTNVELDPEFMYLIPHDSWEKLLDDLDRAANAKGFGCCAYAGRSVRDCPSCIAANDRACTQPIMRDIASRIRKLRGDGDV